jgi:hypothetical protein
VNTNTDQKRLAELRLLQARIEDEIRWLEGTIRGERTRLATALCGTDGGYYRHVRGNKTTPRSKPCTPCKVAHRVAERERAARRQEAA